MRPIDTGTTENQTRSSIAEKLYGNPFLVEDALLSRDIMVVRYRVSDRTGN